MGDREIYIKKLTGEVRWKRAHGIIEEELMCHIDDQKETFMKGGCDEETAERSRVWVYEDGPYADHICEHM